MEEREILGKVRFSQENVYMCVGLMIPYGYLPTNNLNLLNI